MHFVCTSCGSEIVEGDGFCAACGADQSGRASQARCVACGTLLAAHDAFCPGCGDPIAAAPSRSPTITAAASAIPLVAPRAAMRPVGQGSHASSGSAIPLTPPRLRSSLGVQLAAQSRSTPTFAAILPAAAIISILSALVVVAFLAFSRPNSGNAAQQPSIAHEAQASPPPVTQSQPTYAPVQPTHLDCWNCQGRGALDCFACGGTGVCDRCKGTGKSSMKNALGYYTDCDSCKGTGRCQYGTGGQHRNIACNICGGKGWLSPEEARRAEQFKTDPNGNPKWDNQQNGIPSNSGGFSTPMMPPNDGQPTGQGIQDYTKGIQ